MKLADLVIDAGTGQLSATKLWSHAANLIASWALVYMIIYQALDYVWVLAYLAVVGGSAVASKIVSLRFGMNQAPKNDSADVFEGRQP